jgi:hypothetical protein
MMQNWSFLVNIFKETKEHRLATGIWYTRAAWEVIGSSYNVSEGRCLSHNSQNCGRQQVTGKKIAWKRKHGESSSASARHWWKSSKCFIFYNLKYNGDKQQIFSWEIFSLYKTTKIVQYYLNILALDDEKLVYLAIKYLSWFLDYSSTLRRNRQNQFVEDICSLNGIAVLEKLLYRAPNEVN